MVVDFIAYPSLNGQELLVEDISVDFGGVVSRNIKIKDASGVESIFNFPIVLGAGDIYHYPLDKDRAFKITVTTNLAFTSTNVAIAYRSGRYIESKLDGLANSGITAVTQLSNSDLKNYLWRELLLFSAENYTAIGDLVMAQKVLDTLNKICEDLKAV